MTLVRPLACAFLMAATAVPARAQDLLTLDGAVAQALARNASLEAARASTEEAEARVGEAQSHFFPRVTVSEAWQRGNAPVFVFSSLLSARRFGAGNFAIDALNSPAPLGFFHGAITVEQTLFDAGRTGAEVDASESIRRMTTAAGQELALTLTIQVAAGYGRLLTAEASRAAADAAARAAEEDVARAERKRDAGTVTSADVLSLRVHLATMRQQVIETAGQAAVARAEINRLRGAPVDEDFAVQEPPSESSARAGQAGRNWRALADEALAARPDLERSEAAIDLAAAGRRKASAAWWPHVAAQAAYQYDGLSLSDRAASWVIGAEARWTFSTGLGDRATSRAAAAAERRARAERNHARAAVEVEVFGAVRQLESAEARAAVAYAAVAEARESQRIIRDRYDAGMTAVQDVLGAAASVMNAERTRIAAVADLMVAQAALDRAAGRRP